MTTAKFIKTELLKLTAPPEIHNTGLSDAFVVFGMERVSVTAIRKLLYEESEFGDKLYATGVPMDWIFGPDGERVDVMPDTPTPEDPPAPMSSLKPTAAQLLKQAQQDHKTAVAAVYKAERMLLEANKALHKAEDNVNLSTIRLLKEQLGSIYDADVILEICIQRYVSRVRS